jgi:hypothetical protein
MKKTPWFDGTLTPERVGVYEREQEPPFHPRSFYSYWNGYRWLCGRNSPNLAPTEGWSSLCQNLRWRGLSQDPKGKA